MAEDARMEEDHQQAKQVSGLDSGQVTTWTSWHRWTAVSLLAYAFLAVAAACQRALDGSAGILGLIPVTVPELLRQLRGDRHPRPPPRQGAPRSLVAMAPTPPVPGPASAGTPTPTRCRDNDYSCRISAKNPARPAVPPQKAGGNDSNETRPWLLPARAGAARREGPAPERVPGHDGRGDRRSPAPREPLHGGRWETIRDALDANPRTFRLCLILFVAKVVSSGGTAAVAELVRHMLLCGARVAALALTRRTGKRD